MIKSTHKMSPAAWFPLALLAGFLIAGCSAEDTSDGASGDGDDLNVGDNNVGANDVDNREGDDIDVGDSILVSSRGDGSREVCAGDLAEETFRFALCTCSDATSMGVLTTGSFDSLRDRFMLTNVDFDDFDDFAAAIGVNRDLAVPGVLSVGGSAILAGPDGAKLPGLTTVQGDLKVDDNVEFAGVLNVARDLVAGEDFVNLGDGNIGRDLYLGGIMAIPFLTVPGGRIVSESVDVPPPCPCGADDILDINSIVTAARNDHQNDVIGISADHLTTIVGYVNIELPPGRYYFSDIAGAGKLTLKVTGHTAMFVDGDMLLAGDLAIEMADDATLDVFVAGDFRIAGANDFGSISRPSAVRFYVAGSNDVTLTGLTGLVGNLYAPNATVILTGANYVFGSIFAGDFLAMGDTGIYYDRTINQAGEECEDDPPPNNGDGDDPPNHDGDGDGDGDDTCVEYGDDCTKDQDCCEPLVCGDDGKCKELSIVV